MSEWISVETELPPPNKQVIVCRVGKTTDGPFFAIRKNRDVRPWQYLDGDTCYVNITHWMPLPAPPQRPPITAYSSSPLSGSYGLSGSGGGGIGRDNESLP
jgi:hypothetical protein